MKTVRNINSGISSIETLQNPNSLESSPRRSLMKIPMRIIDGMKSGEAGGDKDYASHSSASGTYEVDSPDRSSGSDEKPEFWRSLDELTRTDEFHSFQTREFQDGASELTDPLSRRQFLTLMGASAALAGLAGCRKPVEKIVPYVQTPEETVIGRTEQYATSAVIAGSVAGLLVTSSDGRPIKIEGNPDHPASLGGTTVFQQASILGLYDPDRSKKVRFKGADSDWDSFVDFWRDQRARYAANGGKGLAVLSEEIHSPTLRRLKKEFLTTYPQAAWIEYDPVSDLNIRSGLKWALGGDYAPVYNISKAKVILSLDADFLGLEGDVAANTRQFAEGRKITEERTEMNRLYVVESNFSVTGAGADHRLKVRNSEIGSIAASLAIELTRLGVNVPMDVDPDPLPEKTAKFVNVLAKDLAARRGECLVLGGWGLNPSVHMLIAAINEALENVGSTIGYITTELESWSDSLEQLGTKLAKREIETLVVIGGNPGLNNQALFGLVTKKETGIAHLIHLGEYYDETGRLAEWHLPRTHFLEAWGDTRATNGSLAVQQPLIEPLFGSKSDIEMAGILTNGVDSRGHDAVYETWKSFLPSDGFEKAWRKVLHDGVLPDSTLMILSPSYQPAGWVHFVSLFESRGVKNFKAITEGIELVLKPSPSVWDGRYANNGWLQELPDPMTKLTWDNAALVSPGTAESYSLVTGDVVEITTSDGKVESPVFVLPGHADNSITVTLGYGRKGLGKVAEGAGFDAYPLFMDFKATSAVTRKTGQTYKLATSQNHHSMEGRPIVREGTIEEYIANPEFAAEMVEAGAAPSLWKEHRFDEGYQWGMTIDLNACTGCNACAVACQSENNIPIVGKSGVERGREMHWIRLDRYFTGDAENPQAVTQPVACQQCEMAPCEQVCPVAATTHDAEGLNVMTYNRCVGTRYCSNNCPYKVRRFNFFNYTNKLGELIQMAQNPDVTVRSRGVMEKCTYCVQRINRGKHNAKMENRDVRDGEIVTACQSACPANAIVFGNLNDPESKVSKMKREHRLYDLLGELNTRPRTSYLAKIRNPNPELVTS